MPDSKKRLPTVLVTDADRGSAVAIIRSFSRRGWRVIAAAEDSLSPGFYSRHTDKRVAYPSPATAAEAFVEMMLDVLQKNAVDLLIPVTEEVILLVADERERFEALCEIAMPATEILEGTRNKALTMEMARRAGVPVPLTFAVDSTDEAVACAEKLASPIVLKPALSRRVDPRTGATEKFTVAYASDVAILKEKMQAYEGRCTVLLQEYVSGEGQGVELLARDGVPLAAFQHRRLCEIPVQGGASALRESVALDPELYEYARRLTEALNWTGLLMVEFKVGEQGAKLMEINGRVWGSLPLAVASGMDFPGRLAELYEEHDQERDVKAEGLPETGYTTGVQVANEEMLLLWIVQVLWGKRKFAFLPFPARREALSVLRKVLTPGLLRYDILSLRDLRPGIAMVFKSGRKFFRKLAS